MSDKDRKIEALIEQALAPQHARPVPRNFYEKFRSRLAVAAMVEQERTWLRQAAGFCGIFFAILAAAGAILWILKEFLTPLLFHIPGAMGIMDFVVSGSLYSLRRLALIAAGLALSALVAVLLAFLLPRRTTVNR